MRWIGALFGLAPINDSSTIRQQTSMKQPARAHIAVKRHGGGLTAPGTCEWLFFVLYSQRMTPIGLQTRSTNGTSQTGQRAIRFGGKFEVGSLKIGRTASGPGVPTAMCVVMGVCIRRQIRPNVGSAWGFWNAESVGRWYVRTRRHPTGMPRLEPTARILSATAYSSGSLAMYGPITSS